MTIPLQTEYGKIWQLQEGKGQEGLLKENHYRALFTPQYRETSLRPNDIWLDIGANIGAFAVRAAEFVARVIAVEPEAENVVCLTNNIHLNKITNVVILESAIVGDNSSSVQLALSNTYSSTHRVGSIRGRESITVPAENIDNVVTEHEVNKIKMDCEGSEVEILESMDLDPIDEIIFEYHFSFTKDRPWERYFSILTKLETNGFRIMRGPRAESKTWHTIVWAKRDDH